MDKIDLVYLWVDGNDEEFLREKAQYSSDKSEKYIDSQNECRYRDNHELKYSLRSVAKNAPWINHIFIVTNGQVPNWLDVNNSKITIVNHKEIMPPDALPTFNSEAIESCIANIPGLSEYFLYANDDFFIARPVLPSYFFDRNFNPIIRFKPQAWTEEELQWGLYQKNITNVLNVINQKYGKDFSGLQPTHNIDAYRRSYFKECAEVFKDEFTKVSHQKFREENSAQRLIVSLYSICVKNCSYKVFKTNRQQRENLYLSANKPQRLLALIKKYNPILFCVNDNENVFEQNSKDLIPVLINLFPEEQMWEKMPDIQIEPISENAKTIVFAPDNNYFKYFAVALQSIICNSKSDEKYDIIVFDTDITYNNKILLSKLLPENFSIRYFDMKSYILEYHNDISLNTRAWWSISMYYRCFIPIVMRKYKKVLYLDSDICVNKNLSELFLMDFENKEIMSVLDTVSPILTLRKDMKKHLEENLNLIEPNQYFNSGVIFFNIEVIKKEEYLVKLKSLINENLWQYPDQDILNIIFENSKKLISCEYNLQSGILIINKSYLNKITGEYKKDYLKGLKSPTIIHYTCLEKPWNYPAECLAGVFFDYAKMTPFYEMILYENIVKDCTSKRTIQNVLMKKKIYFNYFVTKFIETFSFGKVRKHYRKKRVGYKKRVKELKQLSKV